MVLYGRKQTGGKVRWGVVGLGLGLEGEECINACSRCSVGSQDVQLGLISTLIVCGSTLLGLSFHTVYLYYLSLSCRLVSALSW